MKKLFLFAALIVLTMQSNAQQGEIIYRDFEPDLVLHVGSYPRDTIWVDFDNDNMPDIYVFWWFSSPTVGVQVRCCNPTAHICQAAENDTIPHLEDWKSFEFYPHLCETNAIRIEKEGGYYYGWFRTYVNYEPHVVNDFCFDKFAFCTVPNYPLIWGQTELWGIEENDDASAFATVHPNPTTGHVIITGKDLKQAEVLNTISQRVATATAMGETMQIDLAKLPAGIYFVNVTDEEGRKCARKVVKE